MNDANYQRSRIATPERIVAVIFVTAWIICAFVIGGLVLAIRAALLFMIPLTLVCMPDLFARMRHSMPNGTGSSSRERPR